MGVFSNGLMGLGPNTLTFFLIFLDNEKERLSSLEKIKQLREQVNDLFSRKFGMFLCCCIFRVLTIFEIFLSN